MRKEIFQDPVERTAFGFLCGLSTLGVAWTVGYLLFDLNAFVEIGAIVVAVVVTWTIVRRSAASPSLPTPSVGSTVPSPFFSVATIVGDLLILAACLNARTDVALSSPWLVINPAIFVLFAATTYAGMMSRSRLATIVHFFTAFSIATVVFKIGFGFDPFVHRAAETALAAAGHIDPKTPLYAGQYSIVAIVHRLLGISVNALDKWLVPLLASTTIPILGVIGLREGWGLSNEAARRWIYLVLALPFAAMTFTVPYNLTVILFILVVCLWPLCRDRQIAIGVSIVAAWSVLCHPLLGVPTAIFVAFTIVEARAAHRVTRTLLGGLTATLLALSVPALLAMNNYRAQAESVFINPFSRLEYFLGLFTDPFPQPPGIVPFELDALYLFHRWLPALLVVAAIITIAIAARRPGSLSCGRMKVTRHPTAVLLLGLLGSIFFVSTAFEFKDIISYEQSEFALRLLAALPFVLLPTLGVGSEMAWQYVVSRRPSLAPTLLVPVTIVAAIALYYSYPQSDAKNNLSGPSVSAADVEAVHLIDDLADGRPYFVLANQMTSAAALQEFGFAHYLTADDRQTLWYPLPTGAALYDFFGQMTYSEPTLNTMLAAAKFTGTPRGYFLTYRYWPGFEWLDERARRISDRWYSVNGGAIIVYEFNSLTEE